MNGMRDDGLERLVEQSEVQGMVTVPSSSSKDGYAFREPVALADHAEYQTLQAHAAGLLGHLSLEDVRKVDSLVTMLFENRKHS